MAAEYVIHEANPTSEVTRTIFRKAKRRKYTVIDNACLDDKRLSFKAVGLLVFLLSKPDDWKFNYRHITTTHADGEAAVKSGMKELEELGYLTRERKRQDDGTFAWVITVHEEPPCGGFPLMDHPLMDNHPLVSTEGPSTEKQTLSLLSEEREQPVTTPAAQIEADFAEWYATYPRKRKPADAKRAYTKARKKASADELLRGAEALARLIRNQQQEVQYTPYPASWLNAESWLDEPEPVRDPFQGPEMRFG